MKFPKITIKDILLIILIGFIFFNRFFSPSDPIKIDPVEIVTPEVSGTVEETIEEAPETEVNIPNKSNPKIIEKIIVDKEYKEKYEKAIKEKDSALSKVLFLESIEINEYKKVLVDNDTIKLVAYAKTRGKLLKYSIDYTIKSDTITYIPEVIKERPKLTILAGLELIVPMQQPLLSTTDPLAVKVDLGIQNKKGDIITAGVDTRKNLYLGYKYAISFKRFKK